MEKAFFGLLVASAIVGFFAGPIWLLVVLLFLANLGIVRNGELLQEQLK